MTDKGDIAKILEELRHQKEEITSAQKDLLHHIGRIEVYVAGLSDQLSRTMEVVLLTSGVQDPARHDLDS